MTLGDRVAGARRRLGITQSELARRADLTPAAVWQIEHGDRTPTSETLRKLSEALQVSSDWLLGQKEEIATSDPRVYAMFRGLDRLSVRDREAILLLYQTLSQEDDK